MRARPAERVESPASPRSWAIGVCVLTCLAFLPTLSNGWVDFDDTAFIVKNAHLSPLSLKNIAWMLTAFHGGHFHPLSWLSLALELDLFGPAPAVFHLTDLALHSANAVLFFFLSRRLLKGENAPAAAAALFFAIHPLRVESVAWAIERRDVLSGFFYLAAVLLYLKSLDEPDRRWKGLSWLCCALSLLSKGVGITLPLALVILDLYQGRRVDWRRLAPYACLAGAAAAAALLAEAENGATMGLARYALSERFSIAVSGLAFYPLKTLLPLHLRPLYEIPQAFDPWSPSFGLSAVFLAAAAAVLLRRRRPAELAASAFYAVTIAPMLGLVRFGPQLAADRYSYLACLPFALLFGGALAAGLALERESRKNAQILCVMVLGVLGAATFLQTARWHDAVTLWRYALAIEPDTAMGQQHLGYTLAGRGLYAQAVARYQKAVELKPDYWLAWDNLGWSLAAQGRLEEACAAYRKALALKPDYWEARSNLGLALGLQNKLAAAEEQFQEALKLAPDEPGLHSNLGLVYFSEKRRGDAAREFTRALELDARQPQARMMLRKLGRL
ncbi:MAG: tetratricopeptide repeat protein [Elusimicrobia bacterium]|nr:tetratricopeptide repeat protein [Elusimicrobiota bacterium]